MTTISKEAVEILNDLIKINNDRIEGYSRAAKELKAADLALQPIFNRMANESRSFVETLEAHIGEAGGESEEGTTMSGKLYRAWMDVKSAFTGQDRESILASCEYGEDQAQRAYDEALSANELDSETKALIIDQKMTLKESHDAIKKLRDIAA